MLSPQLQDLPQAAAEEARDLASARAEIAELRRQLQALRRARAKAAPDPVEIERRIAAAFAEARAPLEARLHEQTELLAQVRQRAAQLGALLDIPSPAGDGAARRSEATDGETRGKEDLASTRQPKRAEAKPQAHSAGRSSAGVSTELDQLLAVPPIAAKLAQAGAHLEPPARAHIPRILAACWNTALRPDELAEGRGTLSASTRARIRAASRALLDIKFLVDEEDGRLRVNHAEIERLRSLHQAISSSYTDNQRAEAR